MLRATDASVVDKATDIINLNFPPSTCLMERAPVPLIGGGATEILDWMSS